eukprot:gene12565-6385_t
MKRFSKKYLNKEFFMIVTPIVLISFLLIVILTSSFLIVSILNPTKNKTVIKFDITKFNTTYNISDIINHDKNNTINLLNFGERIPDTLNHSHARNYLIYKLKENNFNVTLDQFKTNTVLGLKTFTNIIASHFRSKSEQKIVLAAHYDSKIFNFKFLGATDSALSCSMLIEFSRFIDDNIMNGNWTNLKYDFQIVIFDGEEAFKTWTSTDSLYGSRHLASLWQSEGILSNVKLFILLDLIGMKQMTFKNHAVHFDTGTSNLYLQMVELEKIVRKTYPMKTDFSVFSSSSFQFPIDDDHAPFAAKGVPILHLIPYPFPSVWHTSQDTFSALDWNTIFDTQLVLNLMISLFANQNFKE